MSQQATVPCPHCAAKQLVEFRRAGQKLDCTACGQAFTAPKLRELKQLLPDEAQIPSRAAPRTGHIPLRNWLFVIGLATAALAGIGGYFLNEYAKTMIVDERFAEQFTLEREQDVDNYAPADLWVSWETMLANRVLPAWELAATRDIQQLGESLRLTARGLFGLALVGLLTMLGSFLFGKPASSAARA